jgi:hypothetical protein
MNIMSNLMGLGRLRVFRRFLSDGVEDPVTI